MPLGVLNPFWARRLRLVRAQPQAWIVDKRRSGGSVGEHYHQLPPISKAEETINLLLDDAPRERGGSHSPWVVYGPAQAPGRQAAGDVGTLDGDGIWEASLCLPCFTGCAIPNNSNTCFITPIWVSQHISPLPLLCVVGTRESTFFSYLLL